MSNWYTIFLSGRLVVANWYTIFLSGKLGSVYLVHYVSFRKAGKCLTGTLYFLQESWVVSNWYTIFLSGKLGSV